MAYKMTVRRKLAISTWSAPKEGNIYGRLRVPAKEMLEYVAYLREKTGKKITVTHLIGKATGLALKKAPDINGRIFAGRYIPHTSADVSFLVQIDGGDNLAKVKVANADEKSVEEISVELGDAAGKVRKGKDENFQKSLNMLKLLPTFLIRPLVWLTGYLSGAVGLHVPALGVEKFPFGACIITNVGMMGIDQAYAPPTPFARVPVYLAIMAIREVAMAEEGKVFAQKVLDIMITVDHRFIDGFRGGQIAAEIKTALTNPWTLDGHTKRPY